MHGSVIQSITISSATTPTGLGTPHGMDGLDIRKMLLEYSARIIVVLLIVEGVYATAYTGSRSRTRQSLVAHCISVHRKHRR